MDKIQFSIMKYSDDSYGLVKSKNDIETEIKFEKQDLNRLIQILIEAQNII